MELVLVVDYGSAEARNVAKKIRQAGVFSEIVNGEFLEEGLARHNPRGVVLVGSIPLTVPVQLKGRPVWHLGEEPLENVRLKRFLEKNCGFCCQWNLDTFLNQAIENIRSQVGQARVVCGLSGGIDSAVAAVLVHRAIGDQLTCIYVDHGLMREGETEQILETFQTGFGIPLLHIEAQERFFRKLAGIEEPEEKRKIIGTEFVRVFEEAAVDIGQVDFLVQGTLYTDVLESQSQSVGFVKSHHNVGGLPADFALELVEPLRLLFKDEVRLLAEKLALPEEIVWRHPFPGPGLAIRVMGAVTPEKVALVRRADAILLEEIKKARLYKEIWQALAVLTNTRTVAVFRGQRSYDYVLALRLVDSSDGMTAQWHKMPWEILARISERILAEVEGIGRVVYDISSKPPATIEWE